MHHTLLCMESRTGQKAEWNFTACTADCFPWNFLGLLFVMATVLIIYYKQISEGYEDKERFAILKRSVWNGVRSTPLSTARF